MRLTNRENGEILDLTPLRYKPRGKVKRVQHSRQRKIGLEIAFLFGTVAGIVIGISLA